MGGGEGNACGCATRKIQTDCFRDFRRIASLQIQWKFTEKEQNAKKEKNHSCYFHSLYAGIMKCYILYHLDESQHESLRLPLSPLPTERDSSLLSVIIHDSPYPRPSSINESLGRRLRHPRELHTASGNQKLSPFGY